MRIHVRVLRVASVLFWIVAVTRVATADDEIRATMFDADGRESTGPLRMISHEAVRIGEPPVERKWLDIVWVRFGHVENVPHELRGSTIWLANGDRLVAKQISVADEQLKAAWNQSGDSQEFALPLESVRGVSLSLPHARERRDEIIAWLLDRKDARDELRLLNGDVLSGEVTRWREGTVTLKRIGNEVTLPIADVRDIGFNPELLAVPQSKELCWLVSLKDGSRVTLLASKSRVDSETLKATHVSGVSWNIPLASICEWRVLHGRAVFLSDLTPLETKHTPFLPGSRAWALQRDRSVAGRPLRMGGRELPKGLGMHSRSTVTYDLAGKYRVFHAIVGLDDATIGEGTAACGVEVDGRRVFEEPALARAKGPRRQPIINVAGAKRLTLSVDFGELGDSQDHIDWGDAVLLR